MSLSAVTNTRLHNQGNRAKFYSEKLLADKTTANSYLLTLESLCLELDLIESSNDVLFEVFTHYLLQKIREFRSFEEFITRCAPDKAAMQLKLLKKSKKIRRDRLENFFQHTNYLNDNLPALELKHPVDSPAPEKSPEEFWGWLHAEWLRL
ncbi:hypothetical protein F5Y16DRAFT_379658 [Xylariaceae sp. FL0255]|nr:hypothetical protein F5Y16DRAFT_379658 [Xylariaceae sp. FL0255]